MPTKRSYGAGNFFFSLDGDTTALKSVEGGNIRGEVAVVSGTSGRWQKKQLASVSYEPFVIRTSLSLSPPIREWIQASFDARPALKSGAIVAADFDFKAIRYREFRDALITEIGFPALDGSSKEAAFLTLKLTPEEIRYRGGDGAKLKGAVQPKQKQWLASNFRVTIGDLPCGRVSKIDSITIKQGSIEESPGRPGSPRVVSAPWEVSNVKATFSAVDAAPWEEWFRSFVIEGKNSDADELGGAIEFLSPNRSEVLGAVELAHVGIVSFQEEKSAGGNDKIARFSVELYVEEMKLKLESA
jgi:hypothetical protein